MFSGAKVFRTSSEIHCLAKGDTYINWKIKNVIVVEECSFTICYELQEFRKIANKDAEKIQNEEKEKKDELERKQQIK